MPDPADTRRDVTMDALYQAVEQMRRDLDQQNRRDEVQSKAFDKLYEELRQYKDDFVFQSEKPLLLDLLLFFDSLNWFQQALITKEMSPEVVSDSFQYLIDEFLELLYRRDVVMIESRETFDRESQKAIKVVTTSDPTQDYRVQKVLKRGFTRGGRSLRAEEVVLARFRASTEPDGTNDE
jgi:molecular chaperone GrpE (heat shock protein)